MIKNGNIVLSQSITKELGLFVIDDQVEGMNFCPKKIYHKFVDETYPDKTSEAMMDGSYAETLLLGSGARGKITDDLPRKRNGEKSVKQVRIERQMDRLYGFMYARGVRINDSNSQIRLIAKYRPHIWLRGEFDLFPVLVDGSPAIVDVKTTKDVDSDFFSIAEKWVRSSCNHCWGDFDKIAKNQPLFYHFLARNFKSTGVELLTQYNHEHALKYERLFDFFADNDFDGSFYFFVAGIGKPDIDHQMRAYEYQWNIQRETLLDALVDEAVRRVRYCVDTEFAAQPTKELCSGCALRDLCSSAV